MATPPMAKIAAAIPPIVKPSRRDAPEEDLTVGIEDVPVLVPLGLVLVVMGVVVVINVLIWLKVDRVEL